MERILEEMMTYLFLYSYSLSQSISVSLSLNPSLFFSLSFWLCLWLWLCLSLFLFLSFCRQLHTSKEEWLRHGRYAYDPPEMFTVLLDTTNRAWG